MALALKDRVKETTIVVGTGAATLLGSSIGFQPFSVVGNGNTTYYCISDQFGSNWEVGIGTYSSSGNTLARTTVLASSNGGALVVFTAGVKDVFVTYPAEKGVWLDASNNAIGLGTPAAFVGTNITGTASGLTAGNVTTNANLTGAITSSGNATSLGSFTSLQLATALTDETGSGSAVFATSPTLANPTYTGTLTGSTGILNIGSGQLYKDASGNVGIGTSSPARRLHAYGAGTTIKAEGSGTNVYMQLSCNSQSNANSGYIGYDSSSNLLMLTNDTERMRIDSSGKVGIGVTPSASTSAKLQVTGGTTNATTLATSYSNAVVAYVPKSSSGYSLAIASGTSDFPQLQVSANGAASGDLLIQPYGGNLLVGTTSSSTKCAILNTSSNPTLDLTSTVIGNPVARFLSQVAGDVSRSVLNISKYDNNSTTSQIFAQFLINNFAAGSGQINANGANAAAFGAYSDSRLKENITDLPSQLDNILSLRPVEYDYIESEGGGHQIGFIAQEVQEIYPDLVGEREDGMFTLSDMNKNDARLIKAIQELKAIIDTQQEQINSLLGK